MLNLNYLLYSGGLNPNATPLAIPRPLQRQDDLNPNTTTLPVPRPTQYQCSFFETAYLIPNPAQR